MTAATDSNDVDLPGLREIWAARAVVRQHLPPSPTVNHPVLDRELGLRAFVKLENTLPLGAFKVRGGLNLLQTMDEAQRKLGFCSATRGNHGQSLANACRLYGSPCTLFVPVGNNPEKNQAMEALGAKVIVTGEDFDAACDAAEAHAAATGARLVHPGDEPALIAGIGTLAIELLEQAVEPLDAVFVPVGVGSCIAGVAEVFSELSPHTQVIGVQAERAPALTLAWRGGGMADHPVAETMADGLAVRRPCPLTMRSMRAHVHDMVTVSEEEIADAIRMYLRTIHQLAEGAGAASLAGALRMRDRWRGKNVAMVLSGGNIDADTLRRVVQPSRPTSAVA